MITLDDEKSEEPQEETQESKLIEEIGRLTAMLQKVMSREQKAPMVNVAMPSIGQPVSHIHVPEQKPPVVTMKESARPVSATVVSTRPDGTKTTHEITFNYST